MRSGESKTDYYKVLGVSHGANRQQIKRAYRALVRRTHPDANGGKGQPELFKRVGEAYETLSDPRRRAQYDLIMGFRNPERPGEFCCAVLENLFDDLLSKSNMDWWDKSVRASQKKPV